MCVTLADIERAARRLDGAVVETPFLKSQTLSELTGAEIWLKFENLQFTGSFKERGALNRLLTLTADQRARGVVAVSAGNHAQGIALHARRLGIPATIIMPSTTPMVKVARTSSFGAQVELIGDDFAEASREIARYTAQGLTFISPFNDVDVIAGQGTIGLEMLRQGPPLDAVLIAVGGGGLIAGVATAFGRLSPTTKVIGVESELYPSMAIALGNYEGPVIGGSTIAEGIAVNAPGALTLEVSQGAVDDMIVVSEAMIEDAIALLLQIEKTLCEGAGAAGLAALLAARERFQGKRVGIILSGGNIDIRQLTAILQRHLVRSGQLARVRVMAADKVGFLGAAATIIGQFGGNIIDVSHDRVFEDPASRGSSIVFTLEVADRERSGLILAALRHAGFNADLIESRAMTQHPVEEVA